jgi:hypothetical protein
MRRAKSIVAVAALALLALAALAQAGIRKPPLGPWASGGQVVFTLENGTGSQKGKVLLTDFHLRTEVVVGCPDEPVVASVLGRYPLKTFSRGGYTSWGVGRNVSGEPGPQAARVKAGGRVYDGSFYVTWDYEKPSQALRGAIEFDGCRAELVFAKPK